jgi:hypothetical protein
MRLRSKEETKLWIQVHLRFSDTVLREAEPTVLESGLGLGVGLAEIC